MTNLSLENSIVYTKLELVKQRISELLSNTPLLIRTYTKHLLKSQGKYIRSVSTLTAALDKNDGVKDDAITVAIILELIHLSSLVHDDVIDNSDLRRGEVTLQKKYGSKTAILCGDYLFATAASLCKGNQAILNSDILDVAHQIIIGELLQNENQYNYDLTIEQYLETISGKTAKLFEVAFSTGAIFAEESTENIELLKQIGYKIGLIFQIIDDYLDFEAKTFSNSKPVLADLKNGVITLPLIYAFKENPKLLQETKNKKVTPKQIIEQVISGNALSLTYQHALTYKQDIINSLVTMNLSKLKNQYIESIINQILK